MKKTPLQQVKDKVGLKDRREAKERLVNELLPLLEDTDPAARKRLKSASNAKLLALQSAALEVRQQFKSKANLIKAITAVEFPKGNVPAERSQRLESYSVKRLLDIHRQKAQA